MIVTITVLGEPVPWGTKSAANGRHYPPTKMKHWQTQVTTEARRVMAERPLLTGPLGIEVSAYLPIPASWSERKRARALLYSELPAKRPDLTNLLKAAEDACTGIVFGDDRQICSQHNRKLYSDKPRLEITIEQLQPETPQ